MSNCYVYTAGGFKSLQDVVENALPVIAVDNTLMMQSINVDNWTLNSSNRHYCVVNNDSHFTMWFSDNHQLLVADNREIITISGKQYYNDYQTRTIVFPTRINSDSASKSSLDVKTLQQMAKNQILSTALLQHSRSEIAQLLFEWKQTYGAYYARNYNHMLMLQAVVTASGYMSRVVRNNGFNVVPYATTTTSIDKISSTTKCKLDYIPYDSNHNQLHLIYNVDNYTYVL